MKSRTYLLLLAFLLGLSGLQAQNTQIIRGQVIDTDSEIPLIGATVELISVDPVVGTVTDLDGQFTLENVPLGRQALRVNYLGYEPLTIPNVVVDAGKEVILDFKMAESLTQLDVVEVVAETEKDKAINEMVTLSSKTFSMEEVNRYSGGRSDVSRLASNFAGVATADDSRNDIVIRGNSPTGVLWRLEGIPIPNPNHFATLGTTGGPVSALNPNLLKNSDFITSAFPAEYGNALSGVFDVGFRSGNKNKYEVNLQTGVFTGLEGMIEGPLNKKHTSSFLVSYRHSFASLAQELGMDIGTNATPNYRDLTFKFDLDAGKAGRFALFGILADSDIDFIGAELGDDDLFADPNSDSRADSKIGILGLKHNILINDRSYIRTVLSATSNANTFYISNFFPESTTEQYDSLQIDDTVDRLALSSFYNVKNSARWTARFGITLEQTYLNSFSRIRDGLLSPEDDLKAWVNFRDVNGSVFLIQPFMQHKIKINTNTTLNLGVHGQFHAEQGTGLIEPRAAVNVKTGEKSRLNFGYGLHSQITPLPIYYHRTQNADGSYSENNQDLEFSKAHHFVLGYDYKLAKDWRAKAEIYYQRLFDIPVELDPSSFSMLNTGADFAFPMIDGLVNDGTGDNYGLELTIEKFFSKGYYGLLTGSLFQSKYKGSDGIQRSSAFNNQYVVNLLAGKEYRIGKSKRITFSTDFKLTTAGGRFYTPVDLAASKIAQEEIRDEANAYSEQYDAYFRLDFKVGMKINSKRKKFSQSFYFDAQNITNRENIFVNRYNRRTNEVNRVLQSGFFPDFVYRVQF